MTTKVSFEIYVVLRGELEEISEDALARGSEDYIDVLRQQNVLEGALVIEAQGQSPLRVDDELWAAVQNLCFACISSLLEEKNACYLYRYTSSDSHIVMIPLADLVRIIGEHTPTVTDTMQTLLPALFDCGVRFLKLLERLGGDARETLQYLQPLADKARSALQKHQMLPPT